MSRSRKSRSKLRLRSKEATGGENEDWASNKSEIKFKEDAEREWKGWIDRRIEREENTRFMVEKDEVCCSLRVIKVVNGARDLMGWRNVVIGSLLWWSTLPWQLAFSPSTPTHPCTHYVSMHHCSVYCRGVCACVCVLESAHLYSKSQTLACKVPAAVQINTKTLYATRWKHNFFPRHCRVVLDKINAVSHISLRNMFKTHTISSPWLDHFLFKYILVFLLTLFYITF